MTDKEIADRLSEMRTAGHFVGTYMGMACLPPEAEDYFSEEELDEVRNYLVRWGKEK